VVVTQRLIASSTSGGILFIVAGFKSRYLQLFSVAFPFSVCADRVEIRIELARTRKPDLDTWVDVLEKVELYRLADGNIGILVPLAGKKAHDIELRMRLYDFARSDVLSTELVQGVFAPFGWQDQDILIRVRGTLQTASWGVKMVSGVHDCRTGRRVQGKFRPYGHLWRLFRTGNDLTWDLPRLSFGNGYEVRLRLRASRVPLLAPLSPLLVTGGGVMVLVIWLVVRIVTPLMGWVASLLGGGSP
jgi:hypothetical protein